MWFRNGPLFRRFRKIAQTTVSFVMSIRFVLPQGTRLLIGRIFMKFAVWVFLEIVEKSQVSLKSNKNNGYCHMNTCVHYGHTSISVSYKNCKANQNTHFIYNNFFFPNTVPLLDKVEKCGIARAEPDGTRAETRFRLSPKRTSPFKSVGASVQSTSGSRGVRISLSNTG